MIAYFDASCLAMTILGDPGHDDLRRWIGLAQRTATHSDFSWGELVSALSFRVRTGTLRSEEARSIISNGPALIANWSRQAVVSTDIAIATDIVARFELKLRLPDAIHVAIAERLSAMLVTSDDRQARAAEALGIPVFNPLAGVAQR